MEHNNNVISLIMNCTCAVSMGAFQPIMRSHNSSPVAGNIPFGKKGDGLMTHSKNILTCAIAFCPISTALHGSYQQSGQHHPTTHDGFSKDRKYLRWMQSMFGRNFLVRP